MTVLPLSTSTTTRLPSIFFPSACLYAAVVWGQDKRERERERKVSEMVRTGLIIAYQERTGDFVLTYLCPAWSPRK